MSLSTKLVILTILSNACIVFAYGHGVSFWGSYVFSFPIINGYSDFNFTGSIDEKLASIALVTNFAQLILIFSIVLRRTSKDESIYRIVGAPIMLGCYIATYFSLSNTSRTLYLWTGIPFLIFCIILIYVSVKSFIDETRWRKS